VWKSVWGIKIVKVLNGHFVHVAQLHWNVQGGRRCMWSRATIVWNSQNELDTCSLRYVYRGVAVDVENHRCPLIGTCKVLEKRKTAQAVETTPHIHQGK